MTSLGASRTPAFSLLVLVAAIEQASHWSAIVLLPYFAAPNVSATALGTALACFHIPAVLLHPALHSVAKRSSALVFPAVAALEALATALYAFAAGSASLDNASGLTVPLSLYAAMFACGTASALFQSQIVPHVSETLPPEDFETALGIHLSVMDNVTIVAAAFGPFLFAALIYSGASLSMAFCIFAIVLAVIVPVLSRGLAARSTNDAFSPSSESSAAGLLPTPDPIVPPTDALVESSTNSLAMVGKVLSTPRAILPLLAMVASTASSAFLRPILAMHVFTDLQEGPVYSAVAFAVIHFASLVANNGSTALVGHVGRRPLIIVGLCLGAVGFRCVALSLWTLTAVFVLGFGTNSALVLSLGDLAEACEFEVTGADAVTLISFVVMASGELFGVLAGGAFEDSTGSFSGAVLLWSQVLAAVIIVLLIPQVLEFWYGVFVLWYRAFGAPPTPVSLDFNPLPSASDPNESRPLLTATPEPPRTYDH